MRHARACGRPERSRRCRIADSAPTPWLVSTAVTEGRSTTGCRVRRSPLVCGWHAVARVPGRRQCRRARASGCNRHEEACARSARSQSAWPQVSACRLPVSLARRSPGPWTYAEYGASVWRTHNRQFRVTDLRLLALRSVCARCCSLTASPAPVVRDDARRVSRQARANCERLQFGYGVIHDAALRRPPTSKECSSTVRRASAA